MRLKPFSPSFLAPFRDGCAEDIQQQRRHQLRETQFLLACELQDSEGKEERDQQRHLQNVRATLNGVSALLALEQVPPMPWEAQGSER